MTSSNPGSRVVDGPGGGALSARIDLNDNGELRLAVDRSGASALRPGRLGIVTSAHDYSTGLRFVDRQDDVIDDEYEMVTGKRLRRTVSMSEATLAFRTEDDARLDVVVRVSDDGVAYRYVVRESGDVTVERELSTYELPADARAWVQPYSPNYENERTETTAADANQAEPRSRTGTTCEFGYPTLFRVGDNYVLLTEADVDGRYCGTRLSHEDGGTGYTVTLSEGEPVTSSGPLATPWRTAIVGDLNTLVGSTFVDDLAPVSKLEDTSWIRPGVSVWSWLSEHSSPRDPDRQREFIDFAAARGFDYVLVDEGWQSSWVPELVRYARARGVDVLLWFRWTGLETRAQRDDWFPKLKSWGVAGIKVDFMDSDSQATFRWYDEILRDTERSKLMVNFHGSTIPRGIQRTWPHVMTLEGVRGEENGQLPPREIFLAFTRNIIGSMDFTPTWFSRQDRANSLAHELALPVVYESGWTHLGDHPEAFAEQPEAERYLSQLPTVWDETRLVTGAPEADDTGNREAVFARRQGDRWFLGGVLAGPGGTMRAPLSFLGDDAIEWLVEVVSDSADAGLSRSSRTVTSSDELAVDVPENGGFAAIVSPA